MPRKKILIKPSPRALDQLSKTYDPAAILDTRYRILAVNEAYREDHEGEENLIGKHCYEISHGFDRPCDQMGESCPLHSARESQHRERVLHIHLSPQGKEFVDVEMHPYRDENEQADYFLEVLRSVRLASAEPSATGLVGSSHNFNEMLELVQRVAQEETSVLLLGESGTGKELIARAIHEGSARAKKPFVPVECSGLTESLFESELFGHRKGAFTSAHYDKQGLVELAHEGTLFLDEIGEMTPQLQVKLLRLLETQTFRKVGGTDSKYVDFRLVCATNRDLEGMVKKGEFRSDLYYRLSAFPIELPPLRERRDDIELLAVSLLRRSRDKRKLTLSAEALNCLLSYDYPGNIRELQNMLERARILATGDILECEHFPGICTSKKGFSGGVRKRTQPNAELVLDGMDTLEEMEEKYLAHLLENFSGTRVELANHLGVSLRTLTRKLKTVK